MSRKPFKIKPGLIYSLKEVGYLLTKEIQSTSVYTNACPRFGGLFIILAQKDNSVQIMNKHGIFWMTDYIFKYSKIYDKPPLELITDV